VSVTIAPAAQCVFVNGMVITRLRVPDLIGAQVMGLVCRGLPSTASCCRGFPNPWW
jgi:ribose/xylose/arabinose/galactoside ABC-type transport system permease subunit